MSPATSDTSSEEVVLGAMGASAGTGVTPGVGEPLQKCRRPRPRWYRPRIAHVAAYYDLADPFPVPEKESEAVAGDVAAPDTGIEAESLIVVPMAPERSWPLTVNIVSWSKPKPAPILPEDE